MPRCVAARPRRVGIGQTLTLYYDAEERLSTVDYRLNAGLYHLERVQTGGAERFCQRTPGRAADHPRSGGAGDAGAAGRLPVAILGGRARPGLAARLAELLPVSLTCMPTRGWGSLAHRGGEAHAGLVVLPLRAATRGGSIPALGGPRTSCLRAFLALEQHRQ